MNKQLLLEKYIKVAVKKALKEEEEQQQKAEKAMYLVYRFPGLKKVMEDLMSPAFGRYVSHVDIIAPKPTTFRIDLINGQDFSIKYLGDKKWDIKAAGKKYNYQDMGEVERASQSIADLLELNYAPAEGKEQTSTKPAGPGAEELGPDLAAAATEPSFSAPPAAPSTPATLVPGEEEKPEEENPPAEA